MRVLGLDPGSRRTGFGVVERTGSRLRCIVQGAIAPRYTLQGPTRRQPRRLPKKRSHASSWGTRGYAWDEPLRDLSEG